MRTSSLPRQCKQATNQIFKIFKKQPISVGICVAADRNCASDGSRLKTQKKYLALIEDTEM